METNPAAYGWRIHREHIDGDGERDRIGREFYVTGPRNIDPDIEDRLDGGQGLTFHLYDDDGNLCLVGRGINCEGWEPLEDYGTPGYGCTYIRWPNHPEMDCE